MNCRSMYADLGYNTYEECCADYPEYCDTKEKTCSIMKDYKHFNINTCMKRLLPATPSLTYTYMHVIHINKYIHVIYINIHKHLHVIYI